MGDLDIQAVEEMVKALHSGCGDEMRRKKADEMLTAMKESDNAWQSAGKLLEESGDMLTKFFALQILEETIKYRPNVLAAHDAPTRHAWGGQRSAETHSRSQICQVWDGIGTRQRWLCLRQSTLSGIPPSQCTAGSRKFHQESHHTSGSQYQY